MSIFFPENIISVSSCDYGTYHIGDQRRLRPSWSMEVDEGSGQTKWALMVLMPSLAVFYCGTFGVGFNGINALASRVSTALKLSGTHLAQSDTLKIADCLGTEQQVMSFTTRQFYAGFIGI